jgi:tyrosinase
MAGVRTRRDAAKLPDWDPVLLWYARGVAEMRNRRIDDPTSWRYQAAIHDYVPSGDPLSTPGDVLPSAADQRRFWRQCQHNTWFFLPWHRMYLAYFEQIVAAAVVALGGPADWALPYWNYSDATNSNARRIPAAFRAERLPDGSPNPLRVRARNPGVNDGGIIADDFDVDIAECLREPSYIAQATGGNPGFGGPRTLFNHSGGVVGKLEITPHGSMHVTVGGWMGRFHTAGLDPLFWCHHANIDRLWSVWVGRPGSLGNPTDAQWLTGVAFEFHDAAGNIISHTSSQVVDTTADPLRYEYDDVSDPIGGLESVRRRRRAMGRVPEMVGATEGPIVLTGRPVEAEMPVTAPTGPAREGLESATPQQIHLNIENVRGTGDPIRYAVYLNLPAGADPEQHPDHFAGTLPMFGVAEATSEDRDHPASGLQYALDITETVQRLRERAVWDPNNVRITFVPKRPAAGLESARAAPAAPIEIGRVSLYLS